MERITQLIAYGPEILIVTGLVISGFAGLAAISWLCGLMVRARQYALRWRLHALKEAQLAQGIRLEMAARERAHRQTGSHDELARLRKEAELAKREITDLRKLQSAQDEALAARTLNAERLQAEVDDVKQGMEEMEETTQSLEQQIEIHLQAEQKATGLVRDKADELEVIKEELSHRTQVIRMLESQVSSSQQAAAMANANAQDLQRELDNVRRDNKNLSEQNNLLTKLANHTVAAVA